MGSIREFPSRTPLSLFAMRAVLTSLSHPASCSTAPPDRPFTASRCYMLNFRGRPSGACHRRKRGPSIGVLASQ